MLLFFATFESKLDDFGWLAVGVHFGPPWALMSMVNAFVLCSFMSSLEALMGFEHLLHQRILPFGSRVA